MRLLNKIFTKIITAFVACVIVMPSAGAAVSNLPFTEIGDYGNWMTADNILQFDNAVSEDIKNFQPQANQSVSDYVPIEAKAGLALMNGLSMVSDVLDSSLVRFAIIFMILAYVFWIMFEAYAMIKNGTSAMEFGEKAVKKAAVILIWSIILAFGPAQVFMWVMGPIVAIASYLSDLILNAVASVVGTQLPDTCAAIHDYTINNLSNSMIMDPESAAQLLCIPTRLSGFFATAISTGWQWMLAGIGHSAFTVLVGAIFVVLFLYNGFKFALMAFGVIVDLFLGVMMLPFTAIAETLKDKTSYKGIAGDIFNGFLGLFSAESLSKQIERFVNAAIYFVSLSIVIAVCVALLSGTVSVDMAASVPTLDNTGFIPTVLTGALVTYLASRAGEIAKDLGGSVNDSFGTQTGKDISKLWKGTVDKYNKAKKFIKEVRKK